MGNNSRNNLPHIRNKQILSGAYRKDARDLIVGEYNGLNIVSDEVYNLIRNVDDNGTELLKLVRPSKINNFYNSFFQNAEKEGLCKLICNSFIIGDSFQEFDVEEFNFSKDYPEIIFLIDELYIKQVENGKYIITNKFIKAFAENGIYTLGKAKEEEENTKKREEQLLQEQIIYKGVYDLVMSVFISINEIEKPEISGYEELRTYIESKTSEYLTLQKFAEESRSCCDVFIGVKGVTFEKNPLLSNIMVGYLKGRSQESLRDAVENFLLWIEKTPKEEFMIQVKDSLNIND